MGLLNRKRIRRVAALAALVTGVIPGSASAGDAVALQVDHAHTGATNEPGLDPPLRRQWERRFPRPVSYPVIAGGRVFATTQLGRPDSMERAIVAALSGRSGRTLWSHDLGAGTVRASAAYDGGRLYVLTGHTDLFAFDAVSGRLLWQRDYGEGITTGSPVAAGGVIYVVMGSAVYAVDGRDGSVLWSTPVEGSPAMAVAVTADRVYAAFSGRQVYALDRRTGAVIWHPPQSVHGGGGHTPALYGGRLYVRHRASLPTGYTYDARGGALVGRFHSDVEPAFADPLGFFLDARVPGEWKLLGGTLFARDLRSGAARWRFRGDGHLQSAPLVVNRTVYVGSGTGHLYGLDRRTGRLRWQTHLPESVSGTPFGEMERAMAAGNGLLVVPATRRLVAFR